MSDYLIMMQNFDKKTGMQTNVTKEQFKKIYHAIGEVIGWDTEIDMFQLEDIKNEN